MKVKVLFFASLREALGTTGEELQLPAGVDTVGSLRAHLATRGGAWEALTRAGNLRFAVNQDMAGEATALRPGDEVAFFPPVTGG